MKGMVFTEFMDMVEERFGYEVLDRVIDGAGVEAAYTAVQTYDHAELVRLVVALADETGADAPALLTAYGRHLFGRFHAMYPQYFEGVESSFGFLVRLESFIHPEVKKLYPDAEVPRFDHVLHDDILELTYSSSRPFADLAEGLIIGCAEHYDETIEIKRVDHESDDGHSTTFHLTKVA